MSQVLQHYVTVNKETQERCSDWIESAENDFLSNESLKRERSDSGGENYIDTDSEFDSVSECGAKKRKLGFQLKAEVLQLICEWKSCNFTHKHMLSFVKHVAQHITELEIKVTDNFATYVCQWQSCDYENDDADSIKRHVNFHAYHTKIKCIGKNVRGRVKLPECRREREWKNIIDFLPAHDCEWKECDVPPFSNYQLFLYHVETHVEDNPKGNRVKERVKCLWTNCSNTFPSLYKLRDHVKTHTKEKVVACPDCGNMFANNKRFYDHCKRQIPLEVQGFQCSHCNKFYPTKCILREHMRSHIFNYKCNLCEMSCESPSGLKRHMLYRHSEERNYACELCPHKAKCQRDLDSHMIFHSSRFNFACNVEGCHYSCKYEYSLERHIEKVHHLETRWYCCHECPIRYNKSYKLTKHLMSVHHLQQVNGHRRFQYILEDDGFYRLQTTRFEVVDESIDLQSVNENENVSTQTFSKTGGKRKIITEEGIIVNKSINDEQLVPISTLQNILITIDEIDKDGNIISTKVVEAEETTELPITEEPPKILSMME